VNLPEFRIRSESRNRTIRNATRKPTEYRNPSKPNRKISPAIPRNDAPLCLRGCDTREIT